MSGFLRQSTAVDVLIGPFVDLTDGHVAETGESPAVTLSKNGQALAAKNDATTPAHDAAGHYNCEFDATDTNTVGTLVATVAETAGARAVRHEWQVMDEPAYDVLFGSTSTILTSADVGLLYESDITTVTSQTELIMTTGFDSDNIWRYLVLVVEDASGTEHHVTWATSMVQSSNTIVLDSAPPFTITAATPDKVRIHAIPHPRAALNNYAGATQASLDAGVNIVKVFGTTITGSGTTANPWGS